jgi:hypothetical protein
MQPSPSSRQREISTGEGWVPESKKEIRNSPPAPFEKPPGSRLFMHCIHRMSYPATIGCMAWVPPANGSASLCSAADIYPAPLHFAVGLISTLSLQACFTRRMVGYYSPSCI